MVSRCTAEQIAEAVILWSIQVGKIPVLCYVREDAAKLKHLDLLLSTVDLFEEGFERKFEPAFDEHKQTFLLSKQNFIDYLEPRCLLLAQNNGFFYFILTCAFVSNAIHELSIHNKCIHFSRVSYKLLTRVLEDKFAEVFNDSGWEKLMSYCRNLHNALLPSEGYTLAGCHGANDDSADNCDSRKKCEVRDRNESQLSEIFTDCKGGTLMSFSRNVHNASLPSKGYPLSDSHGTSDDNCDFREKRRVGDWDESRLYNEGLRESKLVQQEERESSYEDQPSSNRKHEEKTIDCPVIDEVLKTESSDEVGSKCLDRPFLNKMEEVMSADSPGSSSMEDVLETESSEDLSSETSIDESSGYYIDMNRNTKRKRIAESREHLAEVLNLIDMFIENHASSNNYDIVVSDNEDIEKLETSLIDMDKPESKNMVSTNVAEDLTNKNCEDKNKGSDSSSQSSEDIPNAQRLEHFEEFSNQPKDERRCKLCDGKKSTFKTKWLQNFQEKYSNYNLVTDSLDICNSRASYSQDIIVSNENSKP